MENHLIMFYTQWADHVKTVLKTVDQLEQELKVQVDRKEVYNNYANKKLLERRYRSLITEKCSEECPYPIFINTKTQKVLCGEQNLEALKTWASDA